MGHIRLSREADLVVVAPATADLIARMAHGLADDLATTALLATDKPVLIAPAMNVRMWEHPATQANLATLRSARRAMRRARTQATMACGEFGIGRMAEPPTIVAAIDAAAVGARSHRSPGRRALVTAGPTREPIDPVRYHRQPLVRQAGPRHRRGLGAPRRRDARWSPARPTLPDPPGVTRGAGRDGAHEMLAACAGRAAGRHRRLRRRRRRLAGRARRPTHKIKKDATARRRRLALVENPDILATLCAAGNGAAAAGRRLRRRDRRRGRPRPAPSASARAATGSSPTTCRRATGTFGGDDNTVHLVDRRDGVESLAAHEQGRGGASDWRARIADHLSGGRQT